MSLYYLAYLVARCSFTLEATKADYGYDGSVYTFDANGEIENSYLFVQLKATDHIRIGKDGCVRFSISKRDVSFWQDEIFPVYLVVFDAQRERAYWVYLQKYFRKHHIRSANIAGKSITVKLFRRLNESAVRSWRDDKSRMLARIGTVDHA